MGFPTPQPAPPQFGLQGAPVYSSPPLRSPTDCAEEVLPEEVLGVTENETGLADRRVSDYHNFQQRFEGLRHSQLTSL